MIAELQVRSIRWDKHWRRLCVRRRSVVAAHTSVYCHFNPPPLSPAPPPILLAQCPDITQHDVRSFEELCHRDNVAAHVPRLHAPVSRCIEGVHMMMMMMICTPSKLPPSVHSLRPVDAHTPPVFPPCPVLMHTNHPVTFLALKSSIDDTTCCSVP